MQKDKSSDDITAALSPIFAEPLRVEETEHKLKQFAHQARLRLAGYKALLPAHGREMIIDIRCLSSQVKYPIST